MDKRPVNLDLSTVKFPVTAIASILHRVTGVVLLAGVLILLWALDQSLSSQEGFDFIKELLANVLVKLVVWAILAAVIYHFVAGVRHLFMDLGFWEELESGKASATVTIALSVVLIALAGVWLW
ncbi:succinate dehydrogenase, cytochrome b556 subunit [Agaribacterium haliotis]|uniref:succinate dehydrogenase, cytochrome b556 subunit n=1 Tax=Agaribacterium haliotis TaxID=2013869 RepID=UPI001177D64C|nr:succinate dehydrogenase, cytochrome b556 subunit [Agaribacterium haliotis]